MRTEEHLGGGPTLVIGGAGFIGTNVAHRLLQEGRRVVVFDSLARPGVENNLRWLGEQHRDLVQIEIGDVRNAHSLRSLVRRLRPSAAFHFAAQVAVTTSLVDPVNDFEVNARGTLNVLEALRAAATAIPLVFTSTNKVYGHLADVELTAGGTRHEPQDIEAREHGFSEGRALSFQSPYGCSKGAAEQYVLDYAKTFGLSAAVFRMSCIYGPHQFGTEDQGWVAHFLIRALEGEPITIYGDGKQVRDVLYVDDLVDALLLARDRMPSLRGQAFNIGGGAAHTVSLLELAEMIGHLLGERPHLAFEAWRPADQRFYVSDIRKFSRATGWQPRVPVRTGVGRLLHWLMEFRSQQRAEESAAGWGARPAEVTVAH